MPVVVRTAWLPDTILGQCIRRRQRFVVRLNENMGEPQAVDTLCHEWAHALAWNYSLDRLAKTPGVDPVEFERASHDEAWGCAYSRVWRAYLEVGRAEA
jgi:Zn-dependent peptidase ImmA (M78 family)